MKIKLLTVIVDIITIEIAKIINIKIRDIN